MRPIRSLLAAATVLTSLGAAIAAVSPAGAAPPSGDTVGVAGYDFVSERATPVTGGDADNRLVFTYVAGQALDDGTVTVDLPRSAWRTPLTAPSSSQSLTQDDVGAVAARPVPTQFDDAATDCVATGFDSDSSVALQAFVLATPTVQRIVVPHVDCAAGAALLIRVNGVRAPRAGRYAFPVTASDAAGTRLATRASLTVVRAPTTRLDLRIPAGPFVVDQPFSAAVLALRPDGRVDSSYRGTVALAPSDLDFCGFVAEAGRTFTFTADDAGVLLLTLDFGFNAADGESRSMVARAVDRTARPDTSAPYDVVLNADPEPTSCNPVSFH